MNSGIHFVAMIERVWRCNWRPKLSKLTDTFGGRARESLQMYWEIVIERVWRCTLRLCSSNFGDAIGDPD